MKNIVENLIEIVAISYTLAFCLNVIVLIINPQASEFLMGTLSFCVGVIVALLYPKTEVKK